MEKTWIVPHPVTDEWFADLDSVIWMKHVIVEYLDGRHEKYYIIGTDDHEDSENGKDNIIYMTYHDKDPDGADRYAGNGIVLDDVKSIEFLD